MAVDVDGEPISIGGARQRRLLALLVIKEGSVVTHDWLAEHVWDDENRPQDAVPPLRVYMSRLRSSLPEPARSWFETEVGGYRLTAPEGTIEHRLFESLRAKATRARELDDPLTALGFLDDALALWRGEPFRELEDFDWALAAIEEIHLDRLEMLEERWEVALALGLHTQITGELAAFTSEHGLRDRAVRQHALALHRSGRTTEALRVIDSHRRELAEQGGLDPSPAVAELERSLLAGDKSLEVEKVGRPLRGYRLLDEIGNGAFSIVWRGVQPSVGRDVAIKQIRAELASQPEFIRRFEAEAHLVAAIEHPHVVPLIDFWRDPDSAYLVMRWLRGGTLERRLDDGPLTVTQTMLLARQVGSALASAHAQGVVHRDVKPANILYDHEENAFLTDFGIALEVAESSGPEAALSPGSPAYAAPEQIRQEQLGPEADVFSFGVVLSECLSDVEVPKSMTWALSRATAEDPSDRFASIDELLVALEPVDSQLSTTPLDERAPPAAPSPLQLNPYKGLRAFDQGDSALFFGRERLTHELVTRLSGDSISSRCVIVVGPSGSGKSSVVRAGLVPAVRAGAIDGSTDWFTSTMVPGADPYESLESALLRIAVNPPSSLLEQLRDGDRGILRCLRRCIGDDDVRVLLTIDQFEEVFTSTAARNADAFLDALAVAVHDPTSPLRLVITIRADYYDRPLTHPTFAPIVKACAVDVTPLAGDELERAIVEPARAAGVEFEPGLVARIASETTGQPAALPLLQYTLSELFDRRDQHVLTADSYDEIGGLSGALAGRAENIFAGSDDVQKASIRRLFGRMVDPTAQSADTRRRVPLADMGEDPSSSWVLEQFGSARLVTFGRDEATREPTIEVAHEALLREWPRLVTWLEEDRDILRSVSTVATAADAWDDGGRAQSDVYRGWRLENSVDLATTSADRLRPLDNEFIEASRAAAVTTRRGEEHRLRRLRRLVVGVGAALVLALIAGGLAILQSNRADDETARAQELAGEAATQARIAEDQTLVAENQTAAAVLSAGAADLATLISRSAAQVGNNSDLAVLLALEAHRRSPGPDTSNAVLNALGSSTFANRTASLAPLNDQSGDCPESRANSDGSTEFGVLDGQLVSRDPDTGLVVDHGPSPAPCVLWLGDAQANKRVAVDSDGRRMWFGSYDGPWQVMKEFDVPTFLLSRSFNESNRVLVHPQSTAANTGVVSLLDDMTGQEIGEPITGGLGFDAAVASDDGLFIATSFGFNPRPEGSGEIVIADGSTGDELLRFDTELHLNSLAIDSDRGELVAGSIESALISTFDLATGELLAEVPVTSTSSSFSSGGVSIRSDGLIVVVSRSRIDLVDRRTGAIGVPVRLRGTIAAAARPDGSVLTFTADRRATIVDPANNALVEQVWQVEPFAQIHIRDGTAAVIGQATGNPEIIDLATGARSTFELHAPDGERNVHPVAYPDGESYWTIDEGASLSRWEGDRLVSRIVLNGFPFTGNPDEDSWAIVTSGSQAGYLSVQLVDLSTDALRVALTIPAPTAATAHRSADGGVHVLDSNGRLHTYDRNGSLVSEMIIAERDWSPFRVDPRRNIGTLISLDPSSGRLAMPGLLGEALIVDPSTGEVQVLTNVDAVRTVTFARNGELLVILSEDGSVSLWDLERGQSAGKVWTGNGLGGSSATWYDESTDSIWVATSGKLIQVPLDPAGWVARSCEIVGRGFTQDEWDRFVPGDEPVQSACA